jgi:hypothetical protein
MSAPLSGAAREVLRALVHGLELREVDGEWIFVGHWQDPAHSGVPSVVMRELFGLQCICRLDGSGAAITEAGEQALSRSTIDAIAAASKWFNGTG